MIVKMKKVTIISSSKSKTEALEGLRKLGLVHIKHIRKPASDDLRLTDETMSSIENAYAVLEAHKKKDIQKKIIWDQRETAEKVKEIIRAEKEKEASLKDLQDIESELVWYEPWGGFDPSDIAKIAEK